MTTTTPGSDRVSLGRKKNTIAEALQLQAQIGELQDQLTVKMSEIKAAMGEATTGTIGKKIVARWSITTRQQVSTKALKDEMPEIARKFTKTVEVRSFKLVTDDE